MLNKIVPSFKGLDMQKFKIHNIGQSEYEGSVDFSTIKNDISSKDVLNAHYYANPDDTEPPYKKGDIASGDFFVDACGQIKVLKNDSPLNIVRKEKYGNLINVIMMVKEVLSDEILKGKTKNFEDGIDCYLPEKVKNIKVGDVIQVDGALEVEFE